MAPPSERKKVWIAVATPRSPGATAFCVATSRAGMVVPSPAPVTSRHSTMAPVGSAFPAAPRVRSAADAASAPAIGTRL